MSNDTTLELSDDELTLLDKHLNFYVSLDSGTRPPSTPEQEHFVKVCQCQTKAETEHEIAYFKFRMLSAKERAATRGQSSEITELGEGVPQQGWFTDADWKRMRGQYLSNSD